MNDTFSTFVAISRYCRWNPELRRRETWEQAVDRYFDYMAKRFDLSSKMNTKQATSYEKCRDYMKRKEIFGSMRALMTAGPALDGDDVASYNCSYVAMERLEDFRNLMYVLMCGTGVGFSVERCHTDKLPMVPETIFKDFDSIITVQDSRAGWADALFTFMSAFMGGKHSKVDTSLVRPAGARLKTFGGRASGPEPFLRLIQFIAGTLYGARGRKLKPIEVHDIVCNIAEVVICGGVRRSALISLSDLGDSEMTHAKSGPWWEQAKYRSLANNSAVYEEKPPLEVFMREFQDLYISRSGERGICNREAMVTLCKRAGRKTDGIKFGTNPCSEIILRPNQFCNLSTVVARPEDTHATLQDKVELATILGTLQSALTNFTFFEERGDTQWAENCKEERLLGVSITGIFDNKITSGEEGPSKLIPFLNHLRGFTHIINHEWADLLSIEHSMSITCIKPEGTTSCVAGSASGMHPRYAPYYIRRVRLSNNDPIGQLMKDSGVPNEPCASFGSTTDIFSFPVASPEGLTRNEVDSINHLDLWAAYQIGYCEHKPSITVSYTDKDFLQIGAWLWHHWAICSGVSLLPSNNMVYSQAPFEEITKEAYDAMVAASPVSVDFLSLPQYELEDNVESTKTLACTADGCEVI